MVVDHGSITMPTQHSFLGINMTALSQGNFLEQTAYGIANGFNIPVQYLMGRGVGDGSMRNLNGTSTSTDVFYKKILKDREPFATTVFALSMSEGFIVIFFFRSIYSSCIL